MGIDATDDRRGTDPRGKLLHLPVTTLAGEAAALRTELVARLDERRGAIVEEMAEALDRAGLTGVLEAGGEPIATRLDVALRIVLSAWEHHRPLHAIELDALAAIGAAAAKSGVPLWRLLSAVQQAGRAGWHYTVGHAVALVDVGRRPTATVQLVGDLSIELFDLMGRMQSQLAAGYTG
jgi:hypothetical protein